MVILITDISRSFSHLRIASLCVFSLKDGIATKLRRVFKPKSIEVSAAIESLPGGYELRFRVKDVNQRPIAVTKAQVQEIIASRDVKLLLSALRDTFEFMSNLNIKIYIKNGAAIVSLQHTMAN